MATYHMSFILPILMQLVDPSQYILVEQRLYWNDASAHCQHTYGTFLASIHSVSDNNEAADLCKSSCASCPKVGSGCFIGLNDRLHEREDARDGWVWQDGSPYDFQNWRNGPTQSEPNQIYDEDCVFIYPSDHPDTGYQGAWADVECEKTYPGYFLCNNPQTTEPTVAPLQTTDGPTTDPSERPTAHPSNIPTIHPTRKPSREPRRDPTMAPSSEPSVVPSKDPSIHPSSAPSHHPSRDPSINPSREPSHRPTNNPSLYSLIITVPLASTGHALYSTSKDKSTTDDKAMGNYRGDTDVYIFTCDTLCIILFSVIIVILTTIIMVVLFMICWHRRPPSQRKETIISASSVGDTVRKVNNEVMLAMHVKDNAAPAHTNTQTINEGEAVAVGGCINVVQLSNIVQNERESESDTNREESSTFSLCAEERKETVVTVGGDAPPKRANENDSDSDSEDMYITNHNATKGNATKGLDEISNDLGL